MMTPYVTSSQPYRYVNDSCIPFTLTNANLLVKIIFGHFPLSSNDPTNPSI
jgi:hypothetical protein